jgi:hypothetical protein
MVPFNFSLEANNLGWIFDLSLALLHLEDLGLVLDIGFESKSTLVIGGFMRTQDLVGCGLPFLRLYQVFLQRRDLDLELFDLLYMVSSNISTRGCRSFIVRETRHGR